MIFGKRKKYHVEVVDTLFSIMPTINSGDLTLFGILMKFQIDELYKSSAPSKLAAFSLAAFFYPEVTKHAQNNNKDFFKYFCAYTGWLGACAKHVLDETNLLSPSDAKELRLCLSNAYKLPFPPKPEYTIGDLIDEHVKMKALVNTTS